MNAMKKNSTERNASAESMRKKRASYNWLMHVFSFAATKAKKRQHSKSCAREREREMKKEHTAHNTKE